jgi:hypothetical protein
MRPASGRVRSSYMGPVICRTLHPDFGAFTFHALTPVNRCKTKGPIS